MSWPSYHIARAWVLTAGTVICLFTLPMNFWLMAVLTFWFVMPLYQLTFHDWICHAYCEPRGSIMTVILLLIFYSHDNNVKSKRNYHIYHHRHWHDHSRDPTYRKLQGVKLWQYCLGLQRNLDLGIPDREVSWIEQQSWVGWMDRHSRLIYMLWLVTMALILPWTWFAVVCILYPWMLHVFMCWHDYHLHGPQQSPDLDWLSVLAGHCAWHHQHHLQWQHEYHGTGVWRWFSPSWYYRHVFFRACGSSR